MTDFVQPFVLANHLANGRIVNISQVATKILQKHNYHNSVSSVLLELMIISCFLGQNLKQEGYITCQIQSNDGILRVAMAEYGFGGKLRSCASYNQGKIAEDDSTIQNLVGTAQLMVLVESGEEKYQGIINLNGKTIVEAFKDYLSKSEQIDAELFISSSIENIFDDRVYKATGIILKKMPDIDFQEDSEWKKFGHFFHTLTANEIMTTSSDEILTRLFHEDGVIIYDKQEVNFSCRCSREKMENIVKTIPSEELENIKKDGKIEIKCQFCGNVEFF